MAATAELLRRIGDRTVIASLSTGKDSVAMCLHLTELGIPHERIYLDTRWENPKVKEHLEYLRQKLGPITELSGALGMVELIRKKGMFPSRLTRFCTQQLKVFPARDYILARVDGGEDIVNAVGIRRGESEARSQMAEWEDQPDFDCEVWRPLVEWSVDDVIAIHKRHDIRPNGLYLLGFKRVGCWPCIHVNKEEIRLLAEVDPARIDEIRQLEQEIALKSAKRYAGLIARFEDGGPTALSKRERTYLLDEDGGIKPWNAPAFFQSPLKEDGGKCWPIDKVVEWAKTKYGGRKRDQQMDLLAFGGINDGCMRWGLCETAPPDRQAS